MATHAPEISGKDAWTCRLALVVEIVLLVYLLDGYYTILRNNPIRGHTVDCVS